MARYAEGHPNRDNEVLRYYQGTRYIDQIETMAREELLALTKALNEHLERAVVALVGVPGAGPQARGEQRQRGRARAGQGVDVGERLCQHAEPQQAPAPHQARVAQAEQVRQQQR